MGAAASLERRRPRGGLARRSPVDPAAAVGRAPPSNGARREGGGTASPALAAAPDRIRAEVERVPRRSAAPGPRPLLGEGDDVERVADRRDLSRRIVAFVLALLLHGPMAWSLVSTSVEVADVGSTPAVPIAFVAVDADDVVDSAVGDAAATPVETPPPDATVPPEPSATTEPAEPTAEPPPPAAVTTSEEIVRPVSDVLPHRRPPPPEVRRKPVAEAPPRRERAETPPRPAAAVGFPVERHSGGRPAGAERADDAAGEGELRSWRSAVLAALARAKTYPEAARARGLSGRAAVRFTIRRDGGVVGIALASSSGVETLDAATLAMPHRATFPAMPAGAGLSQSFTAGVRYDLR